jgi:hypothetical protein
VKAATDADSLHLRVYRFLLRLYPRTFRDEYSAPILQLFHDQLRDSAREGARMSIAGLWFAAVGDLTANSIKVRFEQMSNASMMRSSFLLLAAVAAVGTMFGGGAIGLLLLVGMIGGAIYQRQALFAAPSLSFSPWLVVAAGLLITAIAIAVAMTPDLGGNVRWGLIFLLGYTGILTAVVGMGFLMWRHDSGDGGVGA